MPDKAGAMHVSALTIHQGGDDPAFRVMIHRHFADDVEERGGPGDLQRAVTQMPIHRRQHQLQGLGMSTLKDEDDKRL
jgi:hypothetical protein